MTDSKTISRAQTILSMGSLMVDPDNASAFFVIVRGGAGSHTGSVCCGTSMVLNLPYDAVDGRHPLEKRDRPHLLQAIFPHDPTEHDLRHLAESAVLSTRGSLIVVAIKGDDEELYAARQHLMTVPDVIASVCY